MSSDASYNASPDQSSPMRSTFDRVPLLMRMVVYAFGFLGLVLAAIPCVFYQLDVYLPVVHIDIGWVRWLGVAWTAVFLTLYLAASYVLTYNGKGAFVEFDPPKELVIRGPYHYVRNPVAACLVATMLGEAVAMSSTGILVMFCLFAVLCNFRSDAWKSRCCWSGSVRCTRTTVPVCRVGFRVCAAETERHRFTPAILKMSTGVSGPSDCVCLDSGSTALKPV